jgi:F-type H+-transporting ATPase subunit delta
MPNPRLAFRYAKSLLDLAIERNQLEPIYNDMLTLQRLIKSSKDLQIMLKSPVVTTERKIAVIDAVAKDSIGPVTASFMKLLVQKSREAELSEIITAFIRQYKDKKGIHTVKLTTATPVSEEVKNSIIAQVKKTSNLQQIELETVVNPNIIGGFVLQAGDKLVDASISYDLKQISKQFENNDFIYKVR